jgi:hypothetical protein
MMSRLDKKFVPILFAVNLLVLVHLDLASGWAPGFVATGGISADHQYILDAAYKKLQSDPAFEGSNFPALEAIKAYEGINKPLELLTSYLSEGLGGPGPDVPGNSPWSYHYYNPRTGKGSAPSAVADRYAFLKRGLENRNRILDSPRIGSILEKDAAYLAHFVADLSCPYHINGLPADEALARLSSGDGQLGQDIVGPAAGGDWTNGMKDFKNKYDNNSDVDWFDPWYWDGKINSSHTDCELKWGLVKEVKAAGVLTGYSQAFRQSYGNGEGRNLEEFAEATAAYTNTHLAEWWSISTGSVPDMLDQAVTNVFTAWRASFSALRPSMALEQDPGTGSQKLVVRVKNLENDEAAKDVVVNLKINKGEIQGPDGAVGTSSSYRYPQEIPPRGEAEVGVWAVKGSGEATVTLEVSATFSRTPDSGRAVLEKAFSLKSPIAQAGIVEMDLGIIRYTEAPKTWTIEVPDNFAKVEVGVYGKGEETPNKYGGWNAYLKINGEYAWKFVRHEKDRGGIFYDYLQGQEVVASTGDDRYLDVTKMVKAGKNTITYYHYTSGEGAGIKVKVHTA